MLNLLSTDATVSAVVGIVIGVAIAVVIFGLLLLYAFMPELRKKKGDKAEKPQPAPEAVKETAAADEAVEQAAEEPQEEPREIADQPAEEAEQPTEEVAEEVKEPAEEKAEETEEEEDEKSAPAEEVSRDEGESQEEFEARRAAIAAAPALAASERYDRSYTARLIQSSGVLKEWYSEIKNAALAYKGAKSSIAWKQEKLRCGRKPIAKLIVRGKTLCLYLPIDPSECDERVKIEDVSAKAVNAATPSMLRIKNPYRVRQAKELIALAAEKAELEADPKYKAHDYKADLALKTTDELLAEGLIKITGQTQYSDIVKKS